jgi:hypothetical protein
VLSLREDALFVNRLCSIGMDEQPATDNRSIKTTRLKNGCGIFANI